MNNQRGTSRGLFATVFVVLLLAFFAGVLRNHYADTGMIVAPSRSYMHETGAANSNELHVYKACVADCNAQGLTVTQYRMCVNTCIA